MNECYPDEKSKGCLIRAHDSRKSATWVGQTLKTGRGVESLQQTKGTAQVGPDGGCWLGEAGDTNQKQVSQRKADLAFSSWS